MNKEVNTLIRQAEAQGWVYQRKSKHGVLIAPDGMNRITLPNTPSDWRTLKNIKSLLKQYGFEE